METRTTLGIAFADTLLERIHSWVWISNVYVDEDTIFTQTLQIGSKTYKHK